MLFKPIFFLSILCTSLFSLKGEAKTSKYKYQVAIALAFQDEADYLKEWIEYHKLIGVDHFYLFNHLSRDHYMEVIKPYIDKGEVELFHCLEEDTDGSHYSKIQLDIYNHAVKLAKGKAKWLALIDADEFIVPLEGTSLPDFLKDYEKFGGFFAFWLCFGTSHIYKIPSDKLMIETLLYSNSRVQSGKSIVRPECVDSFISPHYPQYKPPFYVVNADKQAASYMPPITRNKILLFHYYAKDIDHLIRVKYPRRKRWEKWGYHHVGTLDEYIQSLESFNQVYNPFMLRFVPTLRERMGLTSSSIQ